MAVLSVEGGNSYPLQYSGLENSMDRGAWLATVHGVTKRHDWATFTVILKSASRLCNWSASCGMGTQLSTGGAFFLSPVFVTFHRVKKPKLNRAKEGSKWHKFILYFLCYNGYRESWKKFFKSCCHWLLLEPDESCGVLALEKLCNKVSFVSNIRVG